MNNGMAQGGSYKSETLRITASSLANSSPAESPPSMPKFRDSQVMSKSFLASRELFISCNLRSVDPFSTKISRQINSGFSSNTLVTSLMNSTIYSSSLLTGGKLQLSFHSLTPFPRQGYQEASIMFSSD